MQNNDVSDYSLGQLQSFLLQHAFQQFLKFYFIGTEIRSMRQGSVERNGSRARKLSRNFGSTEAFLFGTKTGRERSSSGRPLPWDSYGSLVQVLLELGLSLD